MIRSRASFLCTLVGSFALALLSSPAGAERWKAPNPAELALAAPTIDKDADAEILEWDVRVSEQYDGESPSILFDHYIRLKIFTDRGRDTYGRVDVTYGDDIAVYDVEARTIAADGSIRDVGKADIFRRSLVKGDDLQVKAVSFALPGVQKGSIVEYGWKERHSDSLAANLRLSMQREVPVHVVRYHIKPLGLEDMGYAMRLQGFQMELPPLKREVNDFHVLTVEKIPAFREEPHMPPERQVTAWALVYYERTSAPREPKAFWEDYVKRETDEARKLWRSTDEVRRAATDAVAGAATPDEKIAALVKYVRTKVLRTDVDAAPAEAAPGDARDKSAKEVLKRGRGDAADTLTVFLALAQAAGLDARLALVADRDDIGFDPTMTIRALLPGRVAAVRVGEAWRFVDPARRYSPEARLAWWHEGQTALVSGAKGVEVLTTTVSTPADTARRRVGRFRLLPDGTLEGDLSFEYTGHWGAGLKEGEDDDTPAAREESFKTRMTGRLTGAEVSEIRIENVTDTDKPYRIAAKLRVPAYAQRTGSRLILQPNVFDRGIDATFTKADRRLPIAFNYGRTEDDEITIELPAGYAIEPSPAPAPIAVKPAFSHALTTQVADGRLVVKRKVVFGAQEMLLFEPKYYPALKSFFALMHENDGAAVSLKRATATP
jgi:hypothetical protein